MRKNKISAVDEERANTTNDNERNVTAVAAEGNNVISEKTRLIMHFSLCYFKKRK